MDASESALKEKTHIWNKCCKESVKRESEFYKTMEIAAIDERQEDKERSMLKDTLKKLRKEREDENEAPALLEEMQQNLEEAHARGSENERKLCRELGKHIQSCEKELERPHYIMDMEDDAK